jgi:hypothetical protein
MRERGNDVDFECVGGTLGVGGGGVNETTGILAEREQRQRAPAVEGAEDDVVGLALTTERTVIDASQRQSDAHSEKWRLHCKTSVCERGNFKKKKKKKKKSCATNEPYSMFAVLGLSLNDGTVANKIINVTVRRVDQVSFRNGHIHVEITHRCRIACCNVQTSKYRPQSMSTEPKMANRSMEIRLECSLFKRLLNDSPRLKSRI